MNTTPRILRWSAATLGAALLVAAPAIVHASDLPQTAGSAATKLSAPVFLASSGDSTWASSGGWYLNGSAGLTLVPDVTFNTSSFVGLASFSSGYRIGVTLGKSLFSSSDFDASAPDTWSVAAEFDASYINNSLKSVSSGGASASAAGELSQIPLIVNIVFNYNLTDNLSTYAGFGGGLTRLDATVDTIGGFPVNYSNTETDGTLQASIGLRYKLTDSSSIGIGYKYLDVLHTSVGADIETHTFFLDYNWRF